MRWTTPAGPRKARKPRSAADPVHDGAMEHRIYLRSGTYYLDVRSGGGRSRRSLKTSDPDDARRQADAYAAFIERAVRAEAMPQAPDRTARAVLARLRERSKRRGHSCDITLADVEALLARANGQCELTGLPFCNERRPGWEKAPFSASVDRIDGRLPYSFDNCRIVCLAINIGMNEWGQGVFDQVVRAYVQKQYWGSTEAQAAREPA